MQGTEAAAPCRVGVTPGLSLGLKRKHGGRTFPFLYPEGQRVVVPSFDFSSPGFHHRPLPVRTPEPPSQTGESGARRGVGVRTPPSSHSGDVLVRCVRGGGMC